LLEKLLSPTFERKPREGQVSLYFGDSKESLLACTELFYGYIKLSHWKCNHRHGWSTVIWPIDILLIVAAVIALKAALFENISRSNFWKEIVWGFEKLIQVFTMSGMKLGINNRDLWGYFIMVWWCLVQPRLFKPTYIWMIVFWQIATVPIALNAALFENISRSNFWKEIVWGYEKLIHVFTVSKMKHRMDQRNIIWLFYDCLIMFRAT